MDTQKQRESLETPREETSPPGRQGEKASVPTERAQKEPPRKTRGGARNEARFYAFAALAFALLLLLAPVLRAVRANANLTAPPQDGPQAAVSPSPETSPQATAQATAQATPVATPSQAPMESESPATPLPVFVQTAVVVDGKTVGVLASREAAEELLHDIKAHYEAMIAEEAPLSSSFTAKVELADAQSEETLITLEELYDKLVNGRHPLEVQTVLLREATASISYKEETRRDGTLLKGMRVVVSLGREGVSAVVSRVIYINGEKKKTETDEQAVVRESVNHVVLLGTLAAQSGEPGRHEGENGKKAEGLSFGAPAEGEILSNFGRRNGGMHFGLDYELKEGDSVYAAERGIVASVLVRGNYGLTVELDHGNGFLTRYAHLRSALVALGDTVEKGQQIATAGAPQFGEEGGLHFELRIDGFAYNPRYYLP